MRVATARQAASTGRRFLGCPDRKCGFFEWLDPE
jgi:hypothetical protein